MAVCAIPAEPAAIGRHGVSCGWFNWGPGPANNELVSKQLDPIKESICLHDDSSIPWLYGWQGPGFLNKRVGLNTKMNFLAALGSSRSLVVRRSMGRRTL